MIELIIVVLAGLLLFATVLLGRRRTAGREGDAMDVLARIVARNQTGPKEQAAPAAPGLPAAAPAVPARGSWAEQAGLVQRPELSPLPLLVHQVPPPPPSLASPAPPPPTPTAPAATAPAPTISTPTISMPEVPAATAEPAIRRVYLDDLDPSYNGPPTTPTYYGPPTAPVELAQPFELNTPVQVATSTRPASPWWTEIRLAKQTVVALAAVCAVAGAGMAATLGTSGSSRSALSSAPLIPTGRSTTTAPPTTTPRATLPPSSAPAFNPPATTYPPSTWPSTTTPATTVPGPSTTAPTTPPPTAAPGGPPVVTALSPAAGAPGQSLTVSGSGFYSPGGHISISFDGAEAPGACPIRTTCTVTVPALTPPGPRTVVVVVTTDTGRSNPLTFTYQ